MCQGLIAAPGKMLDKAFQKSPVSSYLEKNYGIRPHTPEQMIAREAGYKRPNKFYQPGGRGYSEAPRQPYAGPAVHTLGIAKMRERGSQGG